MKKILLSIALAALSAGAYATGSYGGGYDYTYSGVQAQVGGSVHSYSGPGNNYGRSSISMTSMAGAFSGANSYGFTHKMYDWCLPTGYGAHTGVTAYGGAFSLTYGTSEGAANGYNFGEASYMAGGYSSYGRGDYWGSQYAGSTSSADVSGTAWTESLLIGNDAGFSLMGTASYARNSGASHAERDYWGGTEVDGYVEGKTFSISGGLSFGSAHGGAYSDADQWGSVGSHTTDGLWYKSSYAEGSASNNSYSDSGVYHTGLAATWTVNGADYEGRAADRWYSPDYAFASDNKHTTSDGFAFGNAGGVTWGDAYVGAYARGGYQFAQGDGLGAGSF